MTRQEYLQIGADLSERSESYLDDCRDADIWAAMTVSSIIGYVTMMRCGMIDSESAVRNMLALSLEE